MAELNTSAGADRHQGIARSKKLSTRVDLTPMVDLGFLLITFFVFTTTISTPAAISLLMPADTEHQPMPVRKSTALTIIPIAGNRVFYYHGQLNEAEKEGLYGVTDFSINNGIGNIIRQKQIDLDAHDQFKRNDLMLIIRPADESSFQNIVDALDEVLINMITHYSFVDLTEEEINFMQTHGIK
ncbi:MAG TPA: biopolymer transporter ExbD [Chitinophagaceae bacterium]